MGRGCKFLGPDLILAVEPETNVHWGVYHVIDTT